MAANTVTSFDKAFKIRYWEKAQKAFGEAFFRSSVLLSRLERRTEPLHGRHMEIPFHKLSPMQGGARAEAAQLPRGAPEQTDVFQITPAHLYFPLWLSGPAISQARSNADAFWQIVDFVVRNANKNMRNMMNMQLYGRKLGELARITAIANSATQTVNDTSLLAVGQSVTIGLAYSPFTCLTQAVTGYYTYAITAVDHAASTVTFAQAINVDAAYAETAGVPTAGYCIYPPNSTTAITASEHANNAINGLTGAIHHYNAYAQWVQGNTDTATYRGSATNNWWTQANRVDGSAGITEDLLMRAAMEAEARGGGKISLILTNPDIWRNLGVTLKNQNPTWLLPQASLEFGWANLGWRSPYDNKGAIPITYDRHCPKNTVYLLDESTLYLGETEALGFMDFDGQTWVNTRLVDEYLAQLVWRGNLICTNPRANTVLYDVPNPTPAL